MEFQPLRIPDVVLIRPSVFGDQRGFFLETWEERKFAAAGIAARFVQDNHSRSVKHTLRGLHYQIKQPQGKLVRVVTGSVYDVAVDLRRGSATFGQWAASILSDENKYAMWVPPGFAHGFLVLSEAADFTYKCTDFYAAEFERSVRWDDVDLRIEWPIPTSAPLTLSAKDATAPAFRDAEMYP
jgi:dTDP-4-dehydrorhamnose 3,5-epimerase